MSILGIAELIERIKAAFVFVNVLLWKVLKRGKGFLQIRNNSQFTWVKKELGLGFRYMFFGVYL